MGEDEPGAGVEGGDRLSECCRPNALLGDTALQPRGICCTTCIGNSGPLPEAIGAAIKDNGILAVSVLRRNRNFEGRVHPLVRANYLASPPLVVWRMALADEWIFDMASEPLALTRAANRFSCATSGRRRREVERHGPFGG